MKRLSGPDFGQNKNEKSEKSLARIIAAWIIEIIIVVVVAATIVYFFGMRTVNQGQSMSPTLEAGDTVLVDRFVYLLKDPEVNDLIVFLPNGNEKSHYYIKRVIAVPGDSVQITDGKVFVNGEEFEEEIEVSAIDNAELAENEVKLGNDEFFVLGDNRNNSEDSRHVGIGNIKDDYIIGKAWFNFTKGKMGRL